jgi:glycine betaine/proline transport system substrate-binding protein
MPRSPSFLCALFPKFLRPLLPFLFLCFWFLFFPQALAQDSLKPCQEIRLADVGWTDITATTAITAELLKQKGYVPKVHILSVPVTFKGLQTGDVDVFLGNWMPTQAADIAPYLQEGSVQKVNTNLQGAQFTFAVPHYVASAGIRSIEEVHAHKERFKGTIYGLEPGNDGNRIVLELIQNNIYNLQGWNLVESSEQGMLIQVQRAIAQKEWILFLGWQPHPMNSAIEIAYLKDPLEKWGPGGGTAEVHTIVSQKFAQNCPALLVFLKNSALPSPKRTNGCGGF